jgi:ubiquinol-cytochrome c reductase cytochrome b subunit
MYYFPYDTLAFYSIEHIMREVKLGWFMRYIHSNGASFFFLFVFIHMFRGLFYFSYIKPRSQVWNVGVLIFLLMIITAFTGYVLP